MNTSNSWYGKRGGFTLIELLIMIAFFAILISFIVAIGGCGINTSNGDGTKVGQVVKLSKQGFISKTWEGQIIRGGMSGGSGGFGTIPFDFTVPNELAPKVQEAMDKQQEVKINYHIAGMYSVFSSESRGHFLTDVTPITNSPAK